jgi:HK97 family phage major capsid protein
MTPDEIRAAIEYLDAYLRAMTVDEAGSVRSMDDAEQTRWDEGLAERERLAHILEQHDRVLNLAPVSGVRGDNPQAPNINRAADPFDLSDLRYDASPSEVRGRAVTALEQVRGLDDTQRQHVTQLVERHGGELIGRVLATGSDTYRAAAAKLMGGQQHLLTDAERQAVIRAQSLTDAAGGFAVPFTLDPTILLTNAGTLSPLRQISRVETIVTEKWNGVSSAGATATYKAEAAEVADNAITLAQPSVDVERLDVFVPFSFEIGADWAGFENDMRMVILDAKSRAENTAFTTGSGADSPQGFVTGLDGTASEVAPTTAETFAVADIYKLEEALGDRFIPNASWLAHRAIYNDIRQFDTTGGASLWERLGAATPPELIGYPAYKSSDMDSGFDAAATADNFILAFGDWKAGFLIVDRVGMNFELVPHLFATANNRPSGQRAILAWCRNGSKVIVPEALRILNVATTA